MIDTHCHLTDTRLGSQLEFVLGRAAAAGVHRMITIGTELEDDRRCLEVCRGRSNLACAVGVHPNYVDQVETDHLQQLREIAADATVVALGETGLDYHYGKESRQRQVEFFEFQLGLAREMDKPVVIHSREAIDDCLAILKNHAAVRAVFHCFTGTLDEAKRILDAGYLLGFTGVITFKNGGELREAVKMCPADRLLVETDAPYLSPEPMRKQKINEPALVMHVAAMVGQLRSLTVEEVDELTTRNAEAFFGTP
jgi:TatD DNase family protein